MEQHSSAKYGVVWAGVVFWGFISRRVTGMPRCANCQAHSLPARPAPITVTCRSIYFPAFLVVFFAVVLAVFFAAVFLAAVFRVFFSPAFSAASSAFL